MPASPAGNNVTARWRENLMNGMSSDEVEKKVEDMFGKADDLMINQEKFEEAK